MSVRYALGAKQKRVIQQLLVEGLLLGIAGGLLGMLLAPRVSAVLITMIWGGGTGDLPFSAKPDLRIMLFKLRAGVAGEFAFQSGAGVAVLAARPGAGAETARDDGAEQSAALSADFGGGADWVEPDAAGGRRAVRTYTPQSEIAQRGICDGSSADVWS